MTELLMDYKEDCMKLFYEETLDNDLMLEIFSIDSRIATMSDTEELRKFLVRKVWFYTECLDVLEKVFDCSVEELMDIYEEHERISNK